MNVCKNNPPLYRGAKIDSLPFKLEPGATFYDKAFFSTSRQLSVATSFLRMANPSQERVLFVIVKHANGIDVSELSEHDGEQEVLFAPSTMFRILSVKRGHTVEGWGGFVATCTRVELAEMH